MPTIADIVREHGRAYLERYGDDVPLSHARALLDIAACRTRGMGAQAYCCDDCGRIEFVPHSCRNRACPSCHAQQTAAWVAARRSELLPVRHHHLVFTLPAELREPARRQQRVLLAALMTAAAEAVQALAEDGRFVGGRIAVLAVLHTHTRALVWHPHVHLLIPGLAVSDDREVRLAHGSFLVPVRALSPIFRAKFAAIVRRELPDFEMPGAAWRKRWVVFSRPCAEGPAPVVDYLARYVCRGPLGDHAILSAGADHVTFRHTDNQTRQTRILTLAPDEFLRRYLQHTLPRGFHRVRYYGLWAPANRPILRNLQLTLATSSPPPPPPAPPPSALASPPGKCHTDQPIRQRTCPACGSPRLSFVERLPRRRTFLRPHIRAAPT